VQLRTPWDDGTTHVAFAPSAFLARLAVLIPRPRVNLLLYYGVLAPRASWRTEIVPHAPVSATDVMPDESPSAGSVSSPNRGWRWADLMRRVFELEWFVHAGYRQLKSSPELARPWYSSCSRLAAREGFGAWGPKRIGFAPSLAAVGEGTVSVHEAADNEKCQWILAGTFRPA